MINKNDEKCKSDLFNQLYFLRFGSHNSEEEVWYLHFTS